MMYEALAHGSRACTQHTVVGVANFAADTVHGCRLVTYSNRFLTRAYKLYFILIIINYEILVMNSYCLLLQSP
jgi:hypothetical protein